MTLASTPLSLVKVYTSTPFPSEALPKEVGPSMAANADHELARTQTTSAKLRRRETFMDRSREKGYDQSVLGCRKSSVARGLRVVRPRRLTGNRYETDYPAPAHTDAPRRCVRCQ